MPPHSVLWDFGANVGTYSLYAASKGHYVVSFEPSTREFGILQRNISLNPGKWLKTENIYADDRTGYSAYPLPDHIKIDTDGADLKILSGLIGILKTTKSVLIEIDPVFENQIRRIFDECRFEEVCQGEDIMHNGIRNVIFRNKGIV